MSNERFQAPSIRAIVTGIGVLVIGTILIVCNLTYIVKTAGWVLLLIPQQLGVIERTSPNEIQTIDLSTPGQEISFARSGSYFVYYEFPFVTNDLVDGRDVPPHLVLACRGTEAPVPFEVVERGLRPYDTPFARGRPVFRFSLSAPDACQLTHSIRWTSIAIVPDHVTGKEAAITGSYVVELAVLCAVFGAPLYLRGQRRRHQRQENRQQAAARAEAMRRVFRSDKSEPRKN